MISIIMPAHNEADYIADCLSAVLASDPGDYSAEVIVVANNCKDDTVRNAQGFTDQARARGWDFEVIDTPEPGKLNALNLGDAQAKGDMRAYLDADVIVSPGLLGQIVAVLATQEPRYTSGTPVVSPASSGVTRAFARIWQRLPFVTIGVPGFGLFAVNTAGRARWGAFPEDIISDDTFVRLSFAPSERVRVSATYSWPMVEGLNNLVRVRRRQDAGVDEIKATFPGLMRNDDTPRLGRGQMAKLALRDPYGFAVYALVKLLVKSPYARSADKWARGR